MIGLGEDGAYTVYDKDRDGVTERLRAAAGYELIAQKMIGTLGSVEANAK